MDVATVSESSAFPQPAQRMSEIKSVALHARVPMRVYGAKAGPRQRDRSFYFFTIFLTDRLAGLAT
jgi:hypothetical protein